MSPTDRGHVAEASPTVTIIWKPGFTDDTFPHQIASFKFVVEIKKPLRSNFPGRHVVVSLLPEMISL